MKIVKYNVLDVELAEELDWLKSHELPIYSVRMISHFSYDDEFEIVLILLDHEVTFLAIANSDRKFTITDYHTGK